MNNKPMSESKKYLVLSRKEGDQIISDLKEKYGEAVKEYSLKERRKIIRWDICNYYIVEVELEFFKPEDLL